MTILDEEYVKFKSQDDNVADLINPKITKLRNTDLRLKLDAWKNMSAVRKNMKKRQNEHGTQIRQAFDNALSLYVGSDITKINKCLVDYNGFCDDKKNQSKDQKTINNFLCNLPEGSH